MVVIFGEAPEKPSGPFLLSLSIALNLNEFIVSGLLRGLFEETPFLFERVVEFGEGVAQFHAAHEAGVVIGDRPLHELVPLYRDPRSDMPVTQYNMKDVEKAGLVKFDFLGLKILIVETGNINLSQLLLSKVTKK